MPRRRMNDAGPHLKIFSPTLRATADIVDICDVARAIWHRFVIPAAALEIASPVLQHLCR
jgi:hypothetical protein